MEQSANIPAAAADKIARAAARCGVTVEKFLAVAAGAFSFSPCRITAEGVPRPVDTSFSPCRITAEPATFPHS